MAATTARSPTTAATWSSSIAVGTDERQRIVVRDLAEPYAMPVELIDNFEHEFTFVGNDGPVLFFKTDVDAPRRRLVAIDLRQAASRADWKEIIPQAEATLTQVSFVGNRFIACYLEGRRPPGQGVRASTASSSATSPLPGIGTAVGFGGKRTDTETFYAFSSFATPPSIYRYDIATGESRLFRRAGGEVQPRRLRSQAGLLPQQGRHARADVRRP